MKKIFKIFKKNRRGVTIAEVMIAMLVILTVSATVVTLITAFSKSSAKLIIRTNAIALGENSFECFKATDSYSDYLRLMYTVSNVKLSISNYNKITEQVPVDPLDPSQGTKTEIVSESAMLSYDAEKYTVRIYVTFRQEQAWFSAYVFDEKSTSIMTIDNYIKAISR